MRIKTEKLHSTISGIWFEVAKARKLVSANSNNFDVDQYSQVENEGKQYYITGTTVVLYPNRLEELSPAELKVVFSIATQLRRYNALWYTDYPNLPDRTKRAIRSLVKREILCSSGDKRFYLVHPLALRRGSVETVVAATKELLCQNRFFSTALIKDLNNPKQIFREDSQSKAKFEKTTQKQKRKTRKIPKNQDPILSKADVNNLSSLE